MRIEFHALLLLLAVAIVAGSPALAADRKVRSDVDVHELYARLSPGMSLQEVARLTGGQLDLLQ
jgi:hypothetical protein